MKRAFCIFCLLALAASAWADDAGQGTAPPQEAPRKVAREPQQRQPAFTPEREAAALSFVRQHHPELEDLLVQLRNGNRREYQRAINDLFLASERLANTKERDPLKYELDLKAWKIDSRIRLLAARLAMTENEALQGELKELLLEKLDVQLEQQLLDRERLATRMEKLDAAIERLRTHREQEAQRALAKVMSELKNARPTKRPAAKAGSNPGGKQDK